MILSADASGDTFTIAAGALPPSLRTGLGAKTVVIAANNSAVIAVDVARHLSATGTIVVTSTDIGSNLAAVLLPRA